MGPMLSNFGWVLEGRLAGMARVRDRDVAELEALGIRAVLCLTESPPAPDLATRGFVVRHEPVPDFAPPGPDALARCVEFIARHLEAGSPVVVHCTAGYGRTGTVLAAYLVLHGLAPEEAIAEVRRLRPWSIETAEQESAVLRFAVESGRTPRGAPGGGAEGDAP
jgi:atypical dual specificity phosphatase